ncbi:glycosyltransferase [Sphingomonas sp. Tas61C01]|uniref:glycosyltransferase n=1 Tax=Sphingomonas sp. Tas61C01 TaxID=3458297 RepID=UPI00403ECFAA
MKIVDVCAFYTPSGGGVRTYVDRKLVAFADRGVDTVVVAPGEHDRVERRGPRATIRWLRSPRFPLDRSYRYFADRTALHRALDEEDADVVEVSSPWRSASMVADWRSERRARARLALIAHADPLSAYAYRWFGGVASTQTIDRAFDWYWRHLRRLDRRFDIVVSASDSLTDRLRDGGLRKVFTDPMGVEPGRFSPTLRDATVRRELLALCALPEDAQLLIGVGRHAPEKRWPMVVQAASIAGMSAPIGLVIVGGGSRQGASVEAIDGNPHVRLLEPVTDRAALARLMASADALIHGCEAETFCFAAAEAIASGLTLIAPDRGGAADLARAGGGVLYRWGDAQAAAAAILAVKRADAAPRPMTGVRTMDDHFDDLLAIYAGRAVAGRQSGLGDGSSTDRRYAGRLR